MFKWLLAGSAVVAAFPLALLLLVGTAAVPRRRALGWQAARRRWRWLRTTAPLVRHALIAVPSNKYPKGFGPFA